MIVEAKTFDAGGMHLLCEGCGKKAVLACDDCAATTCGKHELHHRHDCKQKVKVVLA